MCACFRVCFGVCMCKFVFVHVHDFIANLLCCFHETFT